MNAMTRFRRALVGVVVTAGALAGRAQTALFAEHKGEFVLVRDVVRNWPQVEGPGGKLVEASGQHYKLADVEEFAPVYVAVRDLKVGTRAIEMMEGGRELNQTFTFKAEFETAFALRNVFIVLDLNSEDAGKTLYVQGIGDLAPRDPRNIEIAVPMTQRLGAGKYRLHVYTNGIEVFQSTMPFQYVEHKLDLAVRRRIAGVKDAQPQPFVGPSPEYPAKLRHAKVSGRAVIRFKIGPTGKVLEPEIRSATDPAFGESALAAARQWRFLPKVKAGSPIVSVAEIPFLFGNPPNPSAGSH